METLSQAMQRLQKEGYNSELAPEELEKADPVTWRIDEVCRFEGMSSTGDNSILYAISKTDGSRKALVVNAYGVYANSAVSSFMDRMQSI